MYGVFRRKRVAASPTTSKHTPPPIAMTGSNRRSNCETRVAALSKAVWHKHTLRMALEQRTTHPEVVDLLRDVKDEVHILVLLRRGEDHHARLHLMRTKVSLDALTEMLVHSAIDDDDTLKLARLSALEVPVARN